jgi:hypothetical protein
VNGQFQDLPSAHRGPQDRLRSEDPEPENEAGNDQLTADPPAGTGCSSETLARAERAQRERWIGFLARQIAADILRDATVKEDGDHD